MQNFKPVIEYETILHEVSARRKIEPKTIKNVPHDKEAYDKSEIGRRRRQLDAMFNIYKDAPMHPELLAYWAEQGLKKELFDNNGQSCFDEKYQYSVFTPMGLDKDKKYATIYFCHGGGQPIEWAEHYGFNRLAAVEKYIVVYAQNGGRSNDEVDTEFPRIMNELFKKGYPIDRERIYIAGFSSGSEATAAAACTCPDMAAAIAVMPGGQPFLDLQFYTSPEYYASTKGYRIPGIYIGGTDDGVCFPAPWIVGYDGDELGAGTVENAVENLNIWQRDIAQVKNYAPISREELTERLTTAEDAVGREFGLSFDRSYEFRAEGTDWLGGDLYGEDGAPVMRMIRAKGIPHIIWESQASLVWDFLKHFRRDINTGESIYDTVACRGER